MANKNVASATGDMSHVLPTSPEAVFQDSTTDKENMQSFYPTLADRIKSRSRRGASQQQQHQQPSQQQQQTGPATMPKPKQADRSTTQSTYKIIKRKSEGPPDELPAPQRRKLSPNEAGERKATATSTESKATQIDMPTARHSNDIPNTKINVATQTQATGATCVESKSTQADFPVALQPADVPKVNATTQTLVIEVTPAHSKSTQADLSVARQPEDVPNVNVTTAATVTEPTSTESNSTRADIAALPPQDIRPTNDTAFNQDFVAQMIRALRIRVKPHAKMFGDRQNSSILHLLENAGAANDSEMLFMSGAEAAAKLATGVFHNGPILTEGQQPLSLQSIEHFLGEHYDDDMNVFIQDPSVKIAGGALFAREVTIGAVKRRLLGGKSKGRPWNCLELATHVEDGLRPAFLSGEDSRLLTKVKIEQDQSYAGRRSFPQGYKEVEKWALLAESGALTEPHQDSHGYSTYITINQGTVGFGWLSYPSDQERRQWIANPSSSSVAADRFRYVVMRPGQTVFFPAGTIHFVFRLPSAGHTLAFGGHVLRCSNIAHWVKCLLEEKENTNITNEDLTSSAPGYLDRVEKFVKQAQKNGTTEKWGGANAVEEFLRLKAQFMAT